MLLLCNTARNTVQISHPCCNKVIFTKWQLFKSSKILRNKLVANFLFLNKHNTLFILNTFHLPKFNNM